MTDKRQIARFAWFVDEKDFSYVITDHEYDYDHPSHFAFLSVPFVDVYEAEDAAMRMAEHMNNDAVPLRRVVYNE